jgi:hypothetical protein
MHQQEEQSRSNCLLQQEIATSLTAMRLTPRNDMSFFCPLQIQGQQPLQNLFIAQIRLPAIRRKDCLIEPLVGEADMDGHRVEVIPAAILALTTLAVFYSFASPSICSSLCFDGQCLSANEQNTQHLPVRGRSTAPQLVH